MIEFATLLLTALPNCWNALAFNNSIEIRSSDFARLLRFNETYTTPFNNLVDTLDFYAFDGGMTKLGETVFMSTTSLVFANHACDHKNNFGGISSEAMQPYAEIWQMWNPVGMRIRSELNHAFIAQRDVKRGEMITDDYERYDGFMTDEFDETGHSGLAEIKEWCG
jgi:hypothetical protein